ncbi:MAG: hypothetical protein RI885_2281 [Actinomycetota bacterium]
MPRPPWFPLYVSDYDDDTLDLSLEEDGLYGRMLRAAWRGSPDGCSLPADRTRLARMLRLDVIPACLEMVIDRYWRTTGDRLVNPRLQLEAKTSEERSRMGRKAGLRSGKARRKRREQDVEPDANATRTEPRTKRERNNERNANASTNETRTEGPTERERNANYSQSHSQTQSQPRQILGPSLQSDTHQSSNPRLAKDQAPHAIAATNGDKGENGEDDFRSREEDVSTLVGDVAGKLAMPAGLTPELAAERDRQLSEARAKWGDS